MRPASDDLIAAALT